MPFFSRVFFAIACFFRVIFDGKFASAVEKTKALPPGGTKAKSNDIRSAAGGEREERHAIPPAEVEGDTRDTDSLTPPEGSRVRDTIQDSPSSPGDEDDDLDSVPPVSSESHNTGLRRRSPPKPNTVPPPPDAEPSRVPPTEPSPGTTVPPPSPEAASPTANETGTEAGDATEASSEAAVSDSDQAGQPPSSEISVQVESSRAADPTPDTKAGFAPRERGALLLLALLQREGRFVDFLQQDVTDFDDEQVGAAARVVHEGCRRALKGHLEVSPIRAEAEGDKVTLDVGYDVHANKLVGNVTGKPPYKGAVQHRGWRAEHLELPKEIGDHDPSVLAQAEVEL